MSEAALAQENPAPAESAWMRSFPGDPGGVDPRYGDRFPQVKEAIEQLSGTDFGRVRQLCDEILTLEGKDLRVLGYLALSTLFEQGIEGLLPVIRAYEGLADQHWDSLHPRRPVARQAALEWLNNSRFGAFFERATDAQQAPRLQELLAQIDSFNAVVAKRLPGAPAVFGELRQLVAARLQKLQAAAKPVAPAEEGVHAVPATLAPSAPQRQLSSRTGIGSDVEFQQIGRDVHAYLRQQSDWLRLIAVGRALRWSLRVAPPSDSGRTRVVAPRSAALAAVEAAAAQATWPEMLLACEAAFMEPGGQFCFLLQLRACEAAARMGRADVAAFIGHQTAGLLARLPELVELSFEDGTPFADSQCQSWLEGLSGREEAAAVVSGNDGALAERQLEARQRAKSDGLGQGLSVLDQFATTDGRGRAGVVIAKAQLCLEEGRADLALPALEALAERLEAAGAVDWEPALLLQVWRLQQKALKGAKGAESKAQLEALRRKICRADLTAAAHFL